MQIVIDIPEAAHIACCAVKDIENDGDIFNYIISKAIADGVVLPDNPTNGDMIKVLFPYIEIKDNCDMYYSVNIENLSIDSGLNTVGFRKDWWNSPYKAESEDI